jgi:hypothetical protein
MWDAFTWESAADMQHLKTFIFSIGNQYQDLVPLADLVSPNKSHNILSYEGWAYCARTPDKKNFLVYFEKGCPRAEVRGAILNSVYSAHWFDPREGKWLPANDGKLAANKIGTIVLPELPGKVDWGLKLVYLGPNDPGKPVAELIVHESPWPRRFKKYWRHGLALAVFGLVALVVVWRKWRRPKR